MIRARGRRQGTEREQGGDEKGTDSGQRGDRGGTGDKEGTKREQIGDKEGTGREQTGDKEGTGGHREEGGDEGGTEREQKGNREGTRGGDEEGTETERGQGCYTRLFRARAAPRSHPGPFEPGRLHPTLSGQGGYDKPARLFRASAPLLPKFNLKTTTPDGRSAIKSNLTRRGI